MAGTATRLFPMLSQLLRGRGSEAGPIVLDRHRIYILPTRHGLIFGMLLLTMLIGSINYNLSLGYALTFLLGGMLILAVLHTYRNLLGLSINDGGADPAFAGGAAHFHLQLEAAAPRYAVRLGQAGAETMQLDIEGSRRASIAVPAPQRGRLQPGRFVLSTVYPLGLFRAWSYVAFKHSAIVYPRPDDSGRELDADGASGPGLRESPREGSDDFAGLRSWQPADSPRHVAWKIAARTDVLATKRFSDSQGGTLLLDWDSLPGLEVEVRLSRLARWVLDAEETGLDYVLRIPGKEIAAGQGTAQRQRCLEALALFGLPDEAAPPARPA